MAPWSVQAEANPFILARQCSYEVTKETLAELVQRRSPIDRKSVLTVTYRTCLLHRHPNLSLTLEEKVIAMKDGAILAFHEVIPGFLSLETKIASAQSHVTL